MLTAHMIKLADLSTWMSEVMKASPPLREEMIYWIRPNICATFGWNIVKVKSKKGTLSAKISFIRQGNQENSDPTTRINKHEARLDDLLAKKEGGENGKFDMLYRTDIYTVFFFHFSGGLSSTLSLSNHYRSVIWLSPPHSVSLYKKGGKEKKKRKQ